ncbi:MAG: glyoxylate/hydroxypyruvate reductase A [Pseudomonadota bacterium]
MALLIDIRQPSWMREEWLRDHLTPLLPGVPILCGLEDGPLDQVRALAVSVLYPGVASRLPKLELVQKLGAGVETIVASPELPHQVRVARLVANDASREIAEYCLAYVLAGQRNMAAHEAAQAKQLWDQIGPKVAADTTVAVLGLGVIGGLTAERLRDNGFSVIGWSRSPKTMPEVDCRHGIDALPEILAQADYVCSILPSTPETRDMFDAAMFGRMKPTATLINAGRGDLIVDADLVAALDGGHLAHAVLDVFRKEPLPADHPFWAHPGVTVTPHVSGWRVDDALGDVARNYQRLIAGEPLLNEVNRQMGY